MKTAFAFSRSPYLQHVGLPVLLGLITYRLPLYGDLGGFVRNHLADGLWAYAFLSYILLVWARQPPYGWIVLTILVALGYEGAQALHLAPGTGDWKDAGTYLLFFFIALATNHLIKISTNHLPQNEPNQKTRSRLPRHCFFSIDSYRKPSKQDPHRSV